jgi:hypothetical protein
MEVEGWGNSREDTGEALAAETPSKIKDYLPSSMLFPSQNMIVKVEQGVEDRPPSTQAL